jgi:hypothetical protein
MGTQYPSMVANFKLYFDENLNPDASPPPSATVDDLVQNPPPATSTQPAPDPLMLQRKSDQASFVYARIPKKASVELLGWNQFDKFSMTVDFRDLPIDPRTIRSAAVEIHLGTVTAARFAQGITKPEQDGSRVSIIATRDRNGQVRDDTLLGVFYIDEWEVDEADAGAEVSLSGRSMAAPLVDTKVGTNPAQVQQLLDTLDTSQPLDQVIAAVLQFNPLFAQFNVGVNPGEWPDGTIPAPLTADLIPRHRQGARGNRAGGRASMRGGSSDMSFWDLIYNLCQLAGAYPYFRNTTLLLRPMRSVFDQARTTGFDPSVSTPFVPDQPRTAPGVGSFSIRRLVYGKDVQKLHFNRKFGGLARPKTVRLTCVNHNATDRTLAGVSVQAQWPPTTSDDAARRNRVTQGGQQAQEEFIDIAYPHVSDATRLQEIARNLYEQMARMEMSGTAETKNVASFMGDNTDPDMLRLKPGDAIEFYADVRELAQQQPLVSTVTDHYRLPFDSAVDAIAKRIGDQALAKAIVATARGQSGLVQRAFRTSAVRYTWDATSGVEIALDFQNYYEPRAEDNSVGTDPGSVQKTPVASNQSSGQQPTTLSKYFDTGSSGSGGSS